MIRALVLMLIAMLLRPAAAMVGNTPAVGAGDLARYVVLIVGSTGSFCTGTALARSVVLTAAHCVPPGADYKLVEFDAARRPHLKTITAVVRHPQFSVRGMGTYRGTADLALLKLAAPLPATIVPAALGGGGEPIRVGDRFIVAGFGITHAGDGRSGGTLRAATLVATSHPDSMDVRLTDPATQNKRTGRGACTGDSGAPVFRRDAEGTNLLIGVVSWSTGPNDTRGCGGITGVTPLARYRAWIVDTARTLGAALR